MKPHLKNFSPFVVFLQLFLALGLFGCGTGTTTTITGRPAAPPSPPTELPAALTFPPTVGIDRTKIESPGGSSGLSALQVGDNVTDVIFKSTSGESSGVVEVNRLMDSVFGTLHRIAIPVARPVTKFTGYVPVTSQIQDEETGQYPTHLVRFDFNFEDFDENNDGSKDGFSGCTCPIRLICASGGLCPKTPPAGTVFQAVGFRIWVTDTALVHPAPQRFVSGFFTVLPTDANRGAGLIKGISLNDAVFVSSPSVNVNPDFDILKEETLIEAIYDHSDPENLETEYKVKDPVGKTGLRPALHQEYDQVGPEASSVKTVHLANSEGTSVFFRVLARWKEDQDLLGLSRDVPDSPQDSFVGACATISTGLVNDVDPSDGSACQDLKNLPDIVSDPVFTAFQGSGVDVSGVPFLDSLGDAELTETDVFSDFPPTP